MVVTKICVVVGCNKYVKKNKNTYCSRSCFFKSVRKPKKDKPICEVCDSPANYRCKLCHICWKKGLTKAIKMLGLSKVRKEVKLKNKYCSKHNKFSKGKFCEVCMKRYTKLKHKCIVCGKPVKIMSHRCIDCRNKILKKTSLKQKLEKGDILDKMREDMERDIVEIDEFLNSF